MDISEARTIIKTLAKGVDPITGEVFSEDSPYNHPQVIRALFAAHDACFCGRNAAKTIDERRQENLAGGRPRNAGLPWTDEDRGRIASEFEKGASMAELARAAERTEYAIQSELVRQGLLEPTVGMPGRRG